MACNLAGIIKDGIEFAVMREDYWRDFGSSPREIAIDKN